MGVSGGPLAPQFHVLMRGMILRRHALLLLSLLLAGPAAAQEAPATGGSMIGRIFDATGLRAPPPPSADFVRQSRPGELDYAPLTPAPAQSRKKTAAEMEASGAQLDRAIAENKRKAARVKIPN